MRLFSYFSLFNSLSLSLLPHSIPPFLPSFLPSFLSFFLSFILSFSLSLFLSLYPSLSLTHFLSLSQVDAQTGRNNTTTLSPEEQSTEKQLRALTHIKWNSVSSPACSEGKGEVSIIILFLLSIYRIILFH